MRYQIHHRTEYRFDRPVFLEPHILRLMPASGPCQKLGAFSIHFDPEPACLSCQQDAENNSIHRAWFNDMTESLIVTTESEVETFRTNPFDYIPDEEHCTLPVDYADRPSLSPYIVRENHSGATVHEFATVLAETVSRRLLPFLSALTDNLYRTIRCVVRDDGDPLPAAETLQLREAACRDLTVLFIDACRSQGVAARFVSGFQEGDIDQNERDLHAWPEVFIPGGGWRGYDPSHGLAVSDRHIALAAAATPAGAAPVVATFRGTDATASLQTHIKLITASG